MTINLHAARVVARQYSKTGPARVFPDWSSVVYLYARKYGINTDSLYDAVQQTLKRIK